MKAIPLALLNMTADYYPRTGDDSYGTPSYGTKVTLANVYIEQSKAITIGGLGEIPDGTVTMFFDAENSAPATTVFSNLDKILYGGITFLVRQAVPFVNPMTGSLHHWELKLYGN